MWDHSSPSGTEPGAHCSGSEGFNHWTAREVLQIISSESAKESYTQWCAGVSSYWLMGTHCVFPTLCLVTLRWQLEAAMVGVMIQLKLLNAINPGFRS